MQLDEAGLEQIEYAIEFAYPQRRLPDLRRLPQRGGQGRGLPTRPAASRKISAQLADVGDAHLGAALVFDGGYVISTPRT